MSRREAVTRWARAVQLMAGSASVTLTVSWVDEDRPGADGAIALHAECEGATQFGATSTGRLIVSLDRDTTKALAMGHIRGSIGSLEQQLVQIERAFSAPVLPLEQRSSVPPPGNGQPQDPEAAAKAELQRLREEMVADAQEPPAEEESDDASHE